MTTCDHGIELDRWCSDCESGLAAWIARNEVRYYRANRQRSARLAVACFLALALSLAVIAWRTQ